MWWWSLASMVIGENRIEGGSKKVRWVLGLKILGWLDGGRWRQWWWWLPASMVVGVNGVGGR